MYGHLSYTIYDICIRVVVVPHAYASSACTLYALCMSCVSRVYVMCMSYVSHVYIVCMSCVCLLVRCFDVPIFVACLVAASFVAKDCSMYIYMYYVVVIVRRYCCWLLCCLDCSTYSHTCSNRHIVYV